MSNIETKIKNHNKKIINNNKPNKKKPTNCTQLANYIWKLNEKDEKYTIEWKTLRQTSNRFKPSFMCSLCDLERPYIASASKRKILNKRNELVTQCPHYPREYFQFIFNRINLVYLISFYSIKFIVLLYLCLYCVHIFVFSYNLFINDHFCFLEIPYKS